VETTPRPREIELKLQLPAGSRAVLEASSVFAAAKVKQLHQVTTYFDTPNGILEEAGLTLRIRRTGAGTHIQTVKSRGQSRAVARTRNEWQWPIGRNTPDVDRFAQIRRLAKIAPKIRGRLKPLFITDIRRTARLILLDEHTVVEAAIDEGSIEAGMGREAVSELELELKAGRIGPIYRLAAELQTVVPLWISAESKFARGLQLHTGQMDGARPAQTIQLRRQVRAAHGFNEIIEGTLGHLLANIAPTLRGAAEGMHQMRAGLRATRAALQLFKRHLDAPTVERFDAQLRGFGQLFGTARDWDVFCREMLPAAIAELSANVFRGLNSAAEVERQAARTAVVNAVHGPDFTALVLGLAVWADSVAAQPNIPGDHRMGKRLRTLAPSLLHRVDRKVRNRARHVGRLSAQELHGLRKSIKKLRYDIGSFAGLFRRRSVKAYRDRCEHALEILGLINDAAVTQQLAEKLAVNNRPDLLKPAAVLARWSQRRDRKARLRLKSALKSFRTTPAFDS
jgi:inorganic triphosphatase YgiF